MDDKDELPVDGQPTLRVVPYPSDTNTAGDIFGGWLMSQVDIAGSIAAARVAQGRVATVAVNAFEFHKPVFVGDLVSLYADVIRVGNTSLTVDVVVYAERGWRNKAIYGDTVKVTEAKLTYVALDDNGKPRPVKEI